jgi:hypothetical protein
MRRPWLHALVLAAFVARVALPAFHFHDHEEGERGGECPHHGHASEPETNGPVAAEHEDACEICELLATQAPGLAPEPAPDIASAPPSTAARAHDVHAAPRAATFSLVGAPRGPPPSPSPA